MHTTIDLPETRAVINSWLPVEDIEDGALEQIGNTARHPEVASTVAVMPDCHVGFGVTIGTVFPTVNAVLPNAVGVDIGCFTGDTRIPTLDGSNHPLSELHEKGEAVFIYASTPDGKVVAAKATVLQTRKNAPLAEVTLDNGEKIRCTPDHRFLKRDGTYTEARDLQPSDSLMPFYSQTDEEGYIRIQQNYSGNWQRGHWLVARSGLMGAIPKFEGQRTVIHHKDFDESNNHPSNLEFMGHRDHSRYHRSLVERNTHWQSGAFEARRKAALSAKAATDAGHAYFAARGKANIMRYMAERPEHFTLAVSENGERGKSYLIAYNTSDRGRAKSRELANRMHACEICGEMVKSYIGLYNHRRKYHKDTHNHKVVSVTLLDYTDDVYCLNVPGFHNFALAAGIFVHNCGMCAVHTGIHLDREQMGKPFWRSWAGQVGRDVPTGFRWHKAPQALDELDRPLRATSLQPLLREKAAVQLGTLGGGNHFLEAQVDEHDRIWLMVHSGSRNTGLRIANHYNHLAIESTERRALPVGKDLASLPLDDQTGQDYLHDMQWATDFALASRSQMLDRLLSALLRQVERLDMTLLDTDPEPMINIHHNFAQLETHDGDEVMVHRKGATSAFDGQLGIIPGSMGANSYIVRGLGNAASLKSCSHGAGRRMGRNVARKSISEADYVRSLHDTWTKPSMGYIDEAPGAYKDIETVIGRQADLIEIVHTLKPLITVKGDSKARED